MIDARQCFALFPRRCSGAAGKNKVCQGGVFRVVSAAAAWCALRGQRGDHAVVHGLGQPTRRGVVTYRVSVSEFGVRYPD